MFRDISRNIKYNNRYFSTFTTNLKKSINLRESNGIHPEILKYNEVEELIRELKNPSEGEEGFLYYQFKNRILPGVDDDIGE